MADEVYDGAIGIDLGMLSFSSPTCYLVTCIQAFVLSLGGD